MADVPRQATQAESYSLLGPASSSSQIRFERWLTSLSQGAISWPLVFLLTGVYLVLHFNYVTGPLYPRLFRPVRVVLWAVFFFILGFCGLIYASNFVWTTTMDRSIDRLLSGFPFESFPPLLATCVAAPAQSLLVARAGALIQSKKLRISFFILLGVLILFEFVCSVLVTTANLLYFYGSTGISPLEPFNFNFSLSISLWLSFAIDASITTALALSLKRRRVGFNAGTDSLMLKLILVGVQTASYTSILALLGATTASLYKDFDPRWCFLTYAFFPLLPPSYGCSLYTTLSARRTVDEYLDGGPNSRSLPIPGSQQAGVVEVASRARRTGAERSVASGPIQSVTLSSRTGGGGKEVDDEEGEKGREDAADMV